MASGPPSYICTWPDMTAACGCEPAPMGMTSASMPFCSKKPCSLATIGGICSSVAAVYENVIFSLPEAFAAGLALALVAGLAAALPLVAGFAAGLAPVPAEAAGLAAGAEEAGA